MKNHSLFAIAILLVCAVAGLYYVMKKPQSQTELIKRKLKEMVAIDQALREKVDQAHFDTALWDQIHAVDKQNTAALKDILKGLDKQWITISEFGEDADHEAWLLVQHADLDREFQREILARLEKLCVEKETNCINAAYLADRLNVSEKKPQKYGTQFLIKDGVLTPYEIEDPENIDVRRKSIGLSTLKEYEDKLREVHKMAPSAEK